jgi:hypothetical protein
MQNLVKRQRQALAGSPAAVAIALRVPTSGWQVAFHVKADDHTVIEVTDQAASLVDLVTSTRLPILSIRNGWTGCIRGDDGSTQWWALAIGHMTASPGQPTATFFCRTHLAPKSKDALILDATDGLWAVYDGMWIAAAVGHYTHIQLATRSQSLVQQLRPVSDLTAINTQARATCS